MEAGAEMVGSLDKSNGWQMLRGGKQPIGSWLEEDQTREIRGLPRKLEVEFAGQLGPMYGFYPGEFGDEGRNPLELAYCLIAFCPTELT